MKQSSPIMEFFAQMLQRKEFLIPLTAAQYQFPLHYYGLTSAALLEDLFVDASINFRNNERRDVRLARPEKKTDDDITDAKGEKGWDYQYEGENYSHKVGKDTGGIALLWDSTYQLPADKRYSYPSPIVFVLSQYQGKIGNIEFSTKKKIRITPIALCRNTKFTSGQNIIICRREQNNSWKILEVVHIKNDNETLNQILPREIIWNKMMDFWAQQHPVNEIEIFISYKRKDMRGLKFTAGENVAIDFKALPGIYLFPKESLQNIEVVKNNRGVLIPSKKTRELMNESVNRGDFVYIPNWYAAYAGPRSIDLYQVQRNEFDSLTTAARKLN